jgi:hypothetical protein
MWHGDVPTQRNPRELVSIKGATKRSRRPRSLTVGLRVSQSALEMAERVEFEPA